MTGTRYLPNVLDVCVRSFFAGIKHVGLGRDQEDRSPSDISPRNVRPDNGKGKTTNKGGGGTAEGGGDLRTEFRSDISRLRGLGRVAGRRKLHLFRALIGAQGSRVKWTLQNDQVRPAWPEPGNFWRDRWIIEIVNHSSMLCAYFFERDFFFGKRNESKDWEV